MNLPALCLNPTILNLNCFHHVSGDHWVLQSPEVRQSSYVWSSSLNPCGYPQNTWFLRDGGITGKPRVWKMSICSFWPLRAEKLGNFWKPLLSMIKEWEKWKLQQKDCDEKRKMRHSWWWRCVNPIKTLKQEFSAHKAIDNPISILGNLIYFSPLYLWVWHSGQLASSLPQL